MSTSAIRIEFHTVASSYGPTNRMFHPALRTGKDCMYWPDVTFPNEDEAYSFAARALKDAWDAAAAVAQQWNIHSTEG